MSGEIKNLNSGNPHKGFLGGHGLRPQSATTHTLNVVRQ